MSKANIIRKLTETGATIVMVRHDWLPNGKLIGVRRKVIRTQTNGVQFEGGSWLRFPKANCMRETEKGFEICLEDNGSFEKVMSYEIHPAQA